MLFPFFAIPDIVICPDRGTLYFNSSSLESYDRHINNLLGKFCSLVTSVLSYDIVDSEVKL